MKMFEKDLYKNPLIANVVSLAQQEAKKLKIYDNLEDLNTNIPFFQINNRNILVGGYKHHDNASTMLFWAKYLQKYILPFQPTKSLDGYYNIELHDSYSHTQKVVECREKRDREKRDKDGKNGKNGKNGNHDDDEDDAIDSYRNCLVWSKHKDDDHVVLLPDLYHLINYRNRLIENKDVISWSNKNDKIGFWGSTTGSMNPLKNERIKMCTWFHRIDPTHQLSDCFITNIVQMSKESVLTNIPNFQSIYTPPISIPYQYQYKFLLDIPGNTCAWDRVPLIMNSRSLLFRSPCADMCFYYPLMKNKEHYVDINAHDILNQRSYYLSNPKEVEFIVKNANTFSEIMFSGNIANLYINALFKEAGHLKGR